ncbi:hypothetical protein V6N11_040755 [Hibiscus sabdariffa]|uniref:Cellulose synthase n=1 Tax=Hibiscus sabdariffa TaxID=183260 RepID=A0ABR2RIE7_9ROSI
MGHGNRVHPMSYADPSVPLQPRPMVPKKDIVVYGYGSVSWKDRMEEWKKRQNDKSMEGMMVETLMETSWILTCQFRDAYGLWLTCIIFEIWILDQFPRNDTRETYLDPLSLRYEKEGEPSELASIDVFVSTVDPKKEPPLFCPSLLLIIWLISDDGAAMLTFEAPSETSEFARKWVPFCKKLNIEPRAPEWYFSQKIDYLKDKVHPTLVRESRAMKGGYEEFKVSTAQKLPEDGWTMHDGTPWLGNSLPDHPGMIQVFLGHSGFRDEEGNELPRLVYVSFLKDLMDMKDTVIGMLC